jgi:hypothetical protein
MLSGLSLLSFLFCFVVVAFLEENEFMEIQGKSTDRSQPHFKNNHIHVLTLPTHDATMQAHQTK